MALHLFCNQVTAVRFCHGAPVFLSEALSGCVHGLGPCGQGSNPCRETSFFGGSSGLRRSLARIVTRRIRFPRPPPIRFSSIVAVQHLHTVRCVSSILTWTTKLWAISKMNITQRYERWGGSLILSSPSIYTSCSSMVEQPLDKR